jgi:hypothetical protein
MSSSTDKNRYVKKYGLTDQMIIDYLYDGASLPNEIAESEDLLNYLGLPENFIDAVCCGMDEQKDKVFTGIVLPEDCRIKPYPVQYDSSKQYNDFIYKNVQNKGDLCHAVLLNRYEMYYESSESREVANSGKSYNRFASFLLKYYATRKVFLHGVAGDAVIVGPVFGEGDNGSCDEKNIKFFQDMFINHHSDFCNIDHNDTKQEEKTD